MVALNNVKLKMKNEKKLRWLTAHHSLLIVLYSLFIALSSQLLAQDVHVSARVDSNNVLIGDHIKLNIELEYPSDLKVTWPAIADSLDKIEIIERTSPIIERTQQSIKEKTTFTLCVFDTGTYVIPPFNFTYRKIPQAGPPVDTTELSASTNPIPIFVHGVGVDTTAEIKDIKPPLSVPITLAELLPYLIGIVILGLLILAIYYFVKRKKNVVAEIYNTPKRPAHEIALEALQSLESEKLWQRGEVKLYHSKLSDIIRTYIENRFNILAMESTTYEILEDLNRKNINGSLTHNLQEMLTTADLVKFAKGQPLPNENDTCLKHAYNFIQQTIPQLQPIAEEVKHE
jgi:hypothetical protein